MSIKENNYGEGTSLKLGGKKHSGTIGIDKKGFDFDKAVSQKEILELVSGPIMVADLRLGNIFTTTLTGNVSSFGVKNGAIGTYIFVLRQDSTGSRTVTFASNILWESGTAPTLTTTANAIDIVSVFYDGINFYGGSTLNFS